MSYPELYKRTATGAVQTWRAEVQGGKYRTIHGQIDGVRTTTAWTVCEGKNVGRSNETSPAEQAKKEVDALYVLQRKKGYRDTPDAAKKSTRFQCMLAQKYEDRRDELFHLDRSTKEPLFVQPKLDGIRCIATAKGLFSRQGNRITAVPHIEAVLANLVFDAYPDVVLDGELYNHDLRNDFNEIVSLVKKQKPTAEDLQASAAKVQYWVYDIADGELSFEDRHHFLRSILLRPSAVVCEVPTYRAETEAELDALYEQFLEEGYEGGMVRRGNMKYENKRSTSLLKRKEFMDAEFHLERLEEGVGNAAGMVKRAYMKTSDGRTFKADVVGTQAELRKLLGNMKLVLGKKTTIVFQNYTPDKIPRFPKLKVAHQEWWK